MPRVPRDSWHSFMTHLAFAATHIQVIEQCSALVLGQTLSYSQKNQ